MRIEMGNENAKEGRYDWRSEKVQTVVIGDGLRRTTIVSPPPGKHAFQVFMEVTDPNRGVWANHSADKAPAWVVADEGRSP